MASTKKNYKTVPKKRPLKASKKNKSFWSVFANSKPRQFAVILISMAFIAGLGIVGYYKFINKSEAASGFDYSRYGFPAPQNPNPVLSRSSFQTYKSLWNNYMGKHAIKAGQLLSMDPGMIGGWTLHEQNPDTFYDNCNDSEFNPNTACWTTNWQVGYGIRILEEYGDLQEAMSAMHPNETVAQVGNAVIAASKSRSSKPLDDIYSFPEGITVSQIIADKNSTTNRVRIGILAKDDAIGAYMVGKHMRDYMWMGTRMASAFRAWGSYYSSQSVSNSFDAAYQIVSSPPTLKLTSPSNSSSLTAGTNSIRLSATAYSTTHDQIKVAFRIRKERDCTTAQTSVGPWDSYASSGMAHSYTFSNLTPGTYYWTAKAQDSNGNYSTGASFCGTDGWADAYSFTIPSVTTTTPVDSNTTTTNNPPTISLVSTTLLTASSVKLKATVRDPNNDSVKIQFRLRRDDSTWTAAQKCSSVKNYTSTLVTSGSSISKTFTGLSGGSYAWSARAIDSKGAVSESNLRFCYENSPIDSAKEAYGWATARTFSVPGSK